MTDTQHLDDPTIGSVRCLLQLIGDNLAFLVSVEVVTGQIECPCQHPLFLFVQAILDNLGAVVAQFIGDFLSMATVGIVELNKRFSRRTRRI